VRRALKFLLTAVWLAPSDALAQAPVGGAEAWSGPFALMAAGLGFALAAGLCGLGQGRAAASALDAMARQPGNTNNIRASMLLGLAFIESLVLFVFVIAVILLFVKS
jgi:F-type H+-transporting ATPase subunit c